MIAMTTNNSINVNAEIEPRTAALVERTAWILDNRPRAATQKFAPNRAI
jgi:hypothetical protein